MSFEHHIVNLIDSIYFEGSGGQEHSVLLLGDKERIRPFAEYLEGRGQRVSTRLDDGSYQYILIPCLTERVLMLFQGDIAGMFRSLSETWLLPGGRIIVGMENPNDLDRLTCSISEDGIRYVAYHELSALREELKAGYPESSEILFYPLPSLEMPVVMYTDSFLPGQAEVRAMASLT